jgi:cytochrome c biogenesis protein CcmG, thiol:disulfide interchange protein DsbE
VAAYNRLRPALAAPARLSPAIERRRDRETLLAALLLVAVALLVPSLRTIAVPVRTVSPEGAAAAVLQAEVAPDFTLPATDGSQVRLADYQGQVVLINLWATWCPPCVRETPRLVRLYERYREDGFVLLGVNTTFQDDHAKVMQFVRDQAVSYPVLLDTQDTFGTTYRARVLPTSYLIDRQGKIVQIRVGEIDEAQLDEQIAALLREDAQP